MDEHPTPPPHLPPDAATELRALYKELENAIAACGPRCELSGRCCRFAEYGHTLFLTEVEARYLVAEAPAPIRPLDDGATCPWQDTRGRCTARDARPLGCRVYFCDPSYAGRGEAFTEAFLGHLRTLTERSHLPWNYAPLHRHLLEAERRAAICFPHDTTDFAANAI
jgi:hypothetical protein